MKKKLLTYMLAAAMVMGVLTACSSSADGTGNAGTDTTGMEAATEAEDSGDAEANTASVEVVEFGVVSPNTGSYKIYGEAARNSVKMAVDEINEAGGVLGGKELWVSAYKDDQGDIIEAIDAYKELSVQDIVGVIGTFTSSCSIPMAELAADDSMLMISPTATNVALTEAGSTIFRACFIDPYQGQMAAKFAKDNGWTKAAVVYAKDDKYSSGLKDDFIEAAQEIGIEIVATEDCTSLDMDYSAQAAIAANAGADFVYYPCFMDTVPLFVQQVREAGFEGVIVGGDGWDGVDTNGKEEYFKNCYYSNHYSSEDTSPAVQDYVTKYVELYGDDSLNAVGALYYDSVYMLAQAIDNAGEADTEKVINAMTGMTFSGVTGTFTLDASNNPEKNIVFNTFTNGDVTWVETMSPDDYSGR